MSAEISGYERQEFYDAYVEAICWANAYSEIDGETVPAEESGEEWELSQEARDALRQDCDDFLTPSVVRLINGAARRKRGYSFAQAGHNFAFTRNHHGAGFWDRGLGIVGEALTKLSHPYGDRNVYVENGVGYAE